MIMRSNTLNPYHGGIIKSLLHLHDPYRTDVNAMVSFGWISNIKVLKFVASIIRI